MVRKLGSPFSAHVLIYDGQPTDTPMCAFLWPCCDCARVSEEVLFFVVFYCDKRAEQGKIVVEGMSG